MFGKANFADQDSLSGTPSLLTPLPSPIDESENPIALNTSLPLAEATAFEFAETEPLFIVAKGPILPNGIPYNAFSTRASDGRRFIAVTLDVETDSVISSYIITLVETSDASEDTSGLNLGSATFVGYLQANVYWFNNCHSAR